MYITTILVCTSATLVSFALVLVHWYMHGVEQSNALDRDVTKGSDSHLRLRKTNNWTITFGAFSRILVDFRKNIYWFIVIAMKPG